MARTVGAARLAAAGGQVGGAPGRLAVIGGGWAGLAAAVEGVRRGHRVTLFEMAPQLGGRARSLAGADGRLDNGQHILIGAYVETLGLLASLGVDAHAAFVRLPLTLVHADGSGLRLPPGPPVLAFATAVIRQHAWPLGDRLALLATCARWAVARFRCDPALAVASLTARLSPRLRRDLIDPLCVAALNTAAGEASAATFLRVLRDALFAAPGSADLLLPRVGLSELLPEAARSWLVQAGAEVRMPCRVDQVAAAAAAWSIDGERFERVVLAATPGESARLARAFAPAWADAAAALVHEPIVTVYVQAGTVRLPEPMLTLDASPESSVGAGAGAEPSVSPAPAQFVFDRGRLGGPAGLLAFVTSGAGPWVARGVDAIERATLAQARAALPPLRDVPLAIVRTVVDKRATFRCTPGLVRPPMHVGPGCHAAGDHVDGPYPATLEGAVRSGLAAVGGFT